MSRSTVDAVQVEEPQEHAECKFRMTVEDVRSVLTSELNLFNAALASINRETSVPSSMVLCQLCLNVRHEFDDAQSTHSSQFAFTTCSSRPCRRFVLSH